MRKTPETLKFQVFGSFETLGSKLSHGTSKKVADVCHHLRKASKESFVLMGRANLEKLLLEKVPRTMQEYDNEVCKDIADLFAKIIDYKSEFTSKHSLGVAECAAKISRYMGYDDETVYKMYLAGALHDIGKVVIDNDILEKPGR